MLQFRKYLASCLWLLLPVMVLNAFSGRLPPNFQPDVFWHDIPAWIAWPENSLRIIVFILPVLMPLSIDSPRRRLGLLVYAVGLIAYTAGWLVLMFLPASAWSTSFLGLMAPAYTPLIWLAGIGLIGDRYFVRFIPTWLYLAVAALFLVFHNTHALLVLSRMG